MPGLQTILGAGGVIGRELSRRLHADGHPVRQVSRDPRAVTEGDELASADLLDAEATARAVAGSEVAYLVAGLRYRTDVWQVEWPRIMGNVIEACRRHGCRLVFFDNVYAYGRVHGPMTEQTPFNPSSRKGEVRARIATTLLDAMRAGEIRAAIVRAADFYGPGAALSLTHATVIDRLARGKKPQWVGNAQAEHSFTYTPDAARSAAVIGNAPAAYGQTWHALTSPEPMSGERFVRLACELAGRPFAMQVAPAWMLHAMGWFMPVLKENREMMYQFEHDYRFDSSKMQRVFELSPTTYREGIVTALKAAMAS